MSPNADPSIFPENNVKPKPDAFILLGPEILAQQRKLFQESRINSQDSVNEINETTKLIERNCEGEISIKSKNQQTKKEPVKRKIKVVDNISTEDIKSPKQRKTNNLYQDIVNAIQKKT